MDIKTALAGASCFVISWCLSFFVLLNLIGHVTEILVILSLLLAFCLCTCCSGCFKSITSEMNNIEDNKVLPFP